MTYYGDFSVGAMVYMSYFTCAADLTPTTIVDSTVVSVRDNQGGTIGSVTSDIDSNGVVGFHRFIVDTTNPSYVSGSDYFVIFTQGTVDGVSIIGRVIGSFSIENRSTQAIPTANANADALLDRSNGIETGWTLRQVVRLMSAVLLGKTSNGQKTFKNLPDTKARVTSTLEADNDRTTITYDPD